MGKRDTKAAKAKRADRRGKGSLKTEDKTAKNNLKQAKRDANKKDDDDIDRQLKEFASQLAIDAAPRVAVVPAPSPRANGTLTPHPHRDELLLFGGEHFDGRKNSFFADLLRYSLKKDEWRKVTCKPAPPPRSSHQAVAVPTGSGLLFVLGGEFSSANQSQFYHHRDMWCLDLESWTWEQLSTKNGPSARSGHRMVHVRDRLLVFGGFFDNLRDVKYYNDAYAFDLSLYKWSKVAVAPGAPQPSPRSGCQVVADGAAGVAYVFGGYFKKKVTMQQFDSHKDKSEVEGETGVEMRELWALDVHGGGGWRQLRRAGAAPSARSGSCMVLHKSRLVVFGGVHDEDTPDGEGLVSEFFNDLHAYSLETGKWHAMALTHRSKQRGAGGAKADGGSGGGPQADDEGLPLELAAGGRRRNRNRAGSDEDGAAAATAAAGDDEASSRAESSSAAAPAGSGAAVAMEAGDVGAQLPEPCARMNALSCVRGNMLYIFGGLYEDDEASELTLNDLWRLDLAKLDDWCCLIKGNAPDESTVREDSDGSDAGASEGSESGSESDESGSASESDAPESCSEALD